MMGSFVHRLFSIHVVSLGRVWIVPDIPSIVYRDHVYPRVPSGLNLLDRLDSGDCGSAADPVGFVPASRTVIIAFDFCHWLIG